MLRVGLLADDVGFDKIYKKGDRTLIALLTLLLMFVRSLPPLASLIHPTFKPAHSTYKQAFLPYSSKNNGKAYALALSQKAVFRGKGD